MEPARFSISVLITCFNETRSIVPTIEAIATALGRCGLSWEIMVIDDASVDDSADTIRSFMRERSELPIRLDVHAENRGFIHSVSEAVCAATGQYFWVVAGDNNVDVETAEKLLSHVGRADIVIPKVLSYTGRSLHRRLISKAYSILVRVLSGCPITYFNGSSIYRRTDLVQLRDKISSHAYAADTIIRLLADGCTYVEVPVVYRERLHGKSSALTLKNLKDIGLFLAGLGLRRARRLLQTGEAVLERRELG